MSAVEAAWVVDAETDYPDPIAVPVDGALGPLDARLRPGGSFVLDASTDIPAVYGHGDEVGWQGGEACMVVGPQGVGKSTFVQQLTLGRLGLRARCSAGR